MRGSDPPHRILSPVLPAPKDQNGTVYARRCTLRRGRESGGGTPRPLAHKSLSGKQTVQLQALVSTELRAAGTAGNVARNSRLPLQLHPLVGIAHKEMADKM